MATVKRCGWSSLVDKNYMKYHDEEWGIPVHDDKKLFEMLVLEGAQAGLSWSTILKKREAYQKAFDGFDYEKVAMYRQAKVERLLQDSGIVRNRLKIMSAVRNAKVFIQIRREFGSFDRYIWSFVGKPIINRFKTVKEIPTRTELSDVIAKDLKKRGMNFVGPTIIYAFMQSVGMVNDHTKGCFRYKELAKR
jgi:DNA-3-methyladenine glycosylase I